MYSKTVPFQNVVDGVFDETGISNLRNFYPKLRRLIYRVERDIGFGYGLLIKKIRYSTSDNTISENRIRLPEDLIKIEAFGTCENGLCPGTYNHQGNYLFLHPSLNITEFDLVYYTMLQDGEGNPCVTENHFDCVIAGIKFYMYQPKLWNNEGNLNYGRELKEYYFDRIGEAIGDDVMPTTKEEWSAIAGQLRMSYRDTLIYNQGKSCYEIVPNSVNNEILEPGGGGTPSNQLVYDWQYSDLTKDINDTPTIDQGFLDLQSRNSIEDYLNGATIEYTSIGRVAIAVSDVNKDEYRITDVFGQDITELVFETYYNEDMKVQYYVSIDIYSYGSIYYKLIKN